RLYAEGCAFGIDMAEQRVGAAEQAEIQPGKRQAEKIVLQDCCLDRERKASEWPVLEQRVLQRIVDVIGAHKEHQHGAYCADQEAESDQAEGVGKNLRGHGNDTFGT